MIRLLINDTEFQLVLANNGTAEKLQTVLPATFLMVDLNQNEKFYELSQKLPADAKQVGKIEAGDVMLYGENTLVIFYRSFSTSYSYTRIGKIKETDKLAKIIGNADEVEIVVI